MMRTKTQRAACLLLLITACSSDPGYKAYRDYAKAHLYDLHWVNDAGAEYRQADYPVDYESMPDFAAIPDTDERKQAFFAYLLPAIEHRNAVNRERALILGGIALRLEQDMPLTRPHQEFLASMRRYYKVPDTLSNGEALPILERRLGPLPASLVLAQAAIESGWGRSRFARDANNLFGQWCYTAGCGLVPRNRRAGATHEVRAFESIEAAIDAYYRNLNTNPVYKPVRDLRLAAAELPSGLELAAGLERYSELGDAYIEKVRRFIRSNDLESVTGEG